MKSLLSLTFFCLSQFYFSNVQAQIVFSDETTAAGITVTGGLSGTASASFNDFNNDGFADLYIISRNTGQYFANNQNGQFTLIPATPSLPSNKTLQVGIAGDYDNDGDLDIFVGSDNGMQCFLFRNDGGNTFADVSIATGISSIVTRTFGASWFDFDNNGFLDLILGTISEPNNIFLENSGNETFIDKTNEVNLNGLFSNTRGIATGDYDNDGDIDVFISNVGVTSNHFFRNEGTTFSEIAQSLGLALPGNGSHGAEFVDYDNDGDLDLLFGDIVRLFRNDNGSFIDVTVSAGLNLGAIPFRGSSFNDLDNDGDLDIIILANLVGQKASVYENNGNGTFTDVTATSGLDGTLPGRYHTLAMSDYDNDGRTDLFIGLDPNSQHLLYRNITPIRNWVKIKLIGTLSNKAAIGARIELTAGGKKQFREVNGGEGYRTQDDIVQHFGLADETLIQSIKVSWPSGNVQVLKNVAVNQIMTIFEGEVDITVSLNVPVPIIVPAGGSIFDMTVTVDNSSDSTLNAQVWNTVTLLDFGGEEIGPVGRIPVMPISVPAFGQFSTTFSNFEFPGGVRPGSYLFNWKVGTFPNVELDRDSFGFSKAVGPTLTKAGDDVWGLSPVKEATVPEKFSLEQNYPNPFNPETEIRFQLPEARDVQLTICNLKGQKIRTLVNAMKETGFHSVSWNGKDSAGNVVASGVYIYRMKAGEFVDAKKLTLLR